MIWDAVCGPRQATPAPSPAAPPRIPPEHRRLAAAASSSSTCRAAKPLLPSCHSRRRRVALGHAHHTQSLPSNPLPPHALAHALAPLCLARRTRHLDRAGICLCSRRSGFLVFSVEPRGSTEPVRAQQAVRGGESVICLNTLLGWPDWGGQGGGGGGARGAPASATVASKSPSVRRATEKTAT